MSALFSARGLTRRFPQGDGVLTALESVDLEVARGCVLGVAGPSGSGKSTLANVLGLLDVEFEGALRVDGLDPRTLSAGARAELRLAKVGFVFQSFQLLPMLDVLDNVALPHWRLHGDRGRARSAARALLDRLGLGARVAHDPRRLSGGERQRVAIARALVNDPAAVIADEPTGSLDSQSAQQVLDALLDARHAERTVLLVSHDPAVLGRVDRLIRLVDGRLLPDR